MMGPVGGGRLAGLPGFLSDSKGIDTANASTLAIRFVLSNPNVNVALSGMGSPRMVAENVAAAETGPLSDSEHQTLNKLLGETGRLADLYCTGCGYCLPCKQGVDIPARFEAMNYYKVYGLKEHARTVYSRIRERELKTEGQGDCIECRECEGKCPQNIPVVEQLKETESALAQ